MSMYLGTIIKELRKRRQLTQNQLAEGLCSARHLSRIEQNLSEASSYLLYEFSFRLGKSLLDYLPYAELKNPIYWKEEVDELELLYREKYYSQLVQRVLVFRENKEVQSNRNLKQKIEWYYQIARCYCEDKPCEVEDFLELVRLTKPFQEMEELWSYHLKPFEIRILNSAIFVHLRKEQYEIAEDWMLHLVEILENSYIERMDIGWTNIFYNLGRLYYCQKKYNQALEILNRGIAFCERNNSLYGVDDLCNIKGKVLYALEKTEDALLCFNIFLQLSALLHGEDEERVEICENLRKNYDIASLSYREEKKPEINTINS